MTMKKFLFALGLCTLPLQGCTVIDKPPHEAIEDAQLQGSKALYVAEAGFQGVSILLGESVDQGWLEGEKAAKALEAYDKLKVALDKARKTKHRSDVIIAQIQLADLWATIDAIAP